ncbi:MAG: RHS repeat-associated core domain-containing protein [Acidobacteria bacterium]|nr:RHS repeat-associated core domain-containing protein [Acidobacteriota bacterium]
MSGVPAGAAAKRTTLTSYYNSTPTASDTATNSANAYWNSSAPMVRNAVARTEIAGFSASEITYDDPSTTANPTLIKTWDSTKGALTTPLTAGANGNSISITTEYDPTYHVPISTTDANGIHTQINYGAINGYSGLYPTEVKSAFGTAVQQTVQTEYDFYTGLSKKVTFLGNTATENLVSETEYDAVGRPIKIKAAVGTPLEVWTQTFYDDVNRRVISKADVATKGDGARIATQFFDQLGRVRLTKTLEDAATQSATNETDGIKVQTRYLTTSGYTYQLSSNPYRASVSSIAGSEESMGWTRSKSWSTGIRSEVETFSGAALPAPWGSNTASTGVVTTDTDADRTLVTDQAGKQRISRTNGLGQLKEVWEIVPASDSSTVSVTFPGTAIAHGYRSAYNYDRYGNRNFDEANTTTLPKNCTQAGIPVVCETLRKAVNPSVSVSTNRVVSDQDGDTVDDYLFDPSGNMSRSAENNSLVYDAENKLIQVKNASNQTIGQYSYDGNGKRVKKFVPQTNETTIFVYDASGKLVAEYSTILSQSPQVSYLTNDILGSPRITTDRDGNVFSRRDFMPFGEDITSQESSQRTATLGYAADSVRKKFTGYERDEETDLDFAQARYYTRKLGRFVSVDPISISDGHKANPQRWNLYVYAVNCPTGVIDPDGKKPKTIDIFVVLSKQEEKDGEAPGSE